MKTKLFYILIATMLAGSGASFAQDSGFKLFGSFGAGGIGTDEDSRDPAKLHEYRDLSDGPFGVFELRGRNDRFHLDAFGENLGRDDTYIRVQGGRYGKFQFDFHADWLTHNFGFGPDGARLPYTDIGSISHTLTLFSTDVAELSNSNTPPWTSFGFASDRRDIGGQLEFSGGSPWYVLADGNVVHQFGINKVDAAALGTSPGNGFVDLPYPLHHSTANVSVEAGYQSPRGHFSVNWLESSFSNVNEFLHFQNPFFGFGMDTATFAPNNDYTRISVSGMLRQLPFNSTLSGRMTYDRITDDAEMVDEVLNTSDSDVLTPTSPSSPIFNGQVDNVTGQVSFASEPARNLDTRVYYNFYTRLNTSTNILFNVPLTTTGLVCFEAGTTSPANVNVVCEGERFGYTKHNPGLEAGYRLTPGNRLSAGYDYLDINRDRFDSEQTRENKLFVQWSNTSLDALTARLKYQYLHRRSHFLTDNAGFDANSPFYLERFIRSVDVANLNQHLVKAFFDWTPVKLLDFGFEAYYKRNEYQGVTLGRLDDHRKELYGSISYGDPEKFRVTLFGDIEFINYDSYHRTMNASACPATTPNCFDPFTPPTTTAFNWGAKLKDKNWTVEFGADWPVTEQLVLKGSAIFQETKGNVDFQAQTLADGTPAAALFPINSYDNTERWSINPRAVYLIAGHVELTLGYAYEKYDYTDAQYEGYQYTVGTGITTSYLSGVYAFPDYTAHIAYGTLRYRF
jgi:MtrB/PioB family decaheme-associated outer membrane protein